MSRTVDDLTTDLEARSDTASCLRSLRQDVDAHGATMLRIFDRLAALEAANLDAKLRAREAARRAPVAHPVQTTPAVVLSPRTTIAAGILPQLVGLQAGNYHTPDRTLARWALRLADALLAEASRSDLAEDGLEVELQEGAQDGPDAEEPAA